MHIPNNLPAGVTIAMVDGQLRFRARASRNGKRTSLGTFLTIEAAAKAIVDYKYGFIASSISEHKETIQAKATEQEMDRYFELLASVPPHELDSSGSMLVDDILIPAHAIAAYISRLYGEE